MNNLMRLCAALFISNLFAASVFATPISWTDWQANTSTTANGQLTFGSSVVDVALSSSSNLNFVQLGTGTNYFSGHGSNPSGTAYTNGEIDNAPTAAEMISLNAGGTVTLTFSEAIEDIFIAVVSANGNTMDFGTAVSIDSFGRGYWGSGTPILNGAGTGFYGSGEVHGTIKAAGEFTTLSFTHTSENWHGFTLGVADLAAVPEPASMLLLLTGLLGFGRRGRRKIASHSV